MAFGYREATKDDQLPVVVGPESLLDDQRAFLNAYLVCKTLRGAARATKINRFYHHVWLQEWREYAALFSQLQAYITELKREAIEKRATDGWLEPLVFKGVKTGQSLRRFSDSLSLGYMKANDPKWRDGSQPPVGPASITIEFTQAGATTDPQTITISPGSTGQESGT